MKICFRESDRATMDNGYDEEVIDCLPEHSERPVIDFINRCYVSDYNLGIQRILTEAVMCGLDVRVFIPELKTGEFYTKRRS